jgi:F-type H+-transporting ATPase subunit b
LLHKPLKRVLEQRRERTEGAFLKARADIAAAEARTQEYEQRLREARLVIFKAQEARRQQAQQARADAVLQARTRAHEQVRDARAAIEQDMAAARGGLQAETERLAAEIIRTILRPAGMASAAGGQA